MKKKTLQYLLVFFQQSCAQNQVFLKAEQVFGPTPNKGNEGRWRILYSGVTMMQRNLKSLAQ